MKFFRRQLIKIFLFYIVINITIIGFFYLFLPIILNYPPNSINNQFQIDIDTFTYSQQSAFLIFIGLSLTTIVLIKNLLAINFWLKKLSSSKDSNKINSYLTNIKQKCLNTPFIIYLFNTLTPSVLIPALLLFMNNNFTVVIKISLSIILFFTIASVLAFVFSERIFKNILTELHNQYSNTFNYISPKKTIRIPLSLKILLQTLPLIIVSLIFTSLIAYNTHTKEKGNIYFDNYSDFLNLYLSGKEINDYSDLKNLLDDFSLFNNSHIKFIIKEDGSYECSNNQPLSEFFVKYTLENSLEQDGRTYDYYCIDSEGIAKRFDINGTKYFVGIKYDTSSANFLLVLLLICFLLLIIISSVLIFIILSLSKQIQLITKRFEDIELLNRNNLDLKNDLAITSNDEFGSLISAFNDIQKLTVQNINKIYSSQDLLVERERLASLGQMIGGIAHNLKTPIMSISGAAEGIHDLKNELDRSIGNPVVTDEDFHAIASDIESWVDKIKTHTSYMSDVITAVKGQAVTFSENQVFSFTVTELFKQIDILMRYELKSSLTNLNIQNNVLDTVSITGNINSLVQIINNMISNSIQAYNGKPNSNIDLTADLRDNTIVISVKDYGCGLPDSVKDKLFKEMVTTKGKAGTGLGLFMSYSNIKAHFQGNITYTSEKDMGTTFNIIIPINK